jgi:hypothetical protein
MQKPSLENIDIEEIFKKTSQDPSLLATIDIDKLLNTIENKNNEFLENKTMKIVIQEIFEIINTLHANPETVEGTCKKLSEYRHVDEIRELHKGKFVRWISKKTPTKLNNGGIVMDIKFNDNGIHILCKNSQNRFLQYKFDECFTFQKMTLEEQLILLSYEHLNEL